MNVNPNEWAPPGQAVQAGKAKLASALRWTMIGCGSLCFVGLGSCVGGVWFLGHQGKKMLAEFQASRAASEQTLETQRDPTMIPSWVPAHGDATPVDAFFTEGGAGGSGFFRLRIEQSVADAVAHFRARMADNGFNVETTTVDGRDGAELMGSDADGSRVVAISLTPRTDAVSAVVRYQW